MGLKADTAVYTALVSACRESADWDQQWQLYQQMLEDGLRPDTSMLNALIASASSKGSVKQAADTLQEVRECPSLVGVVPRRFVWLPLGTRRCALLVG